MKCMLFALLPLIFLHFPVNGATDVETMAKRVYDANFNNSPLPVLSKLNPDLTVASAYGVQKAYVKRMLLNDQIIGFKAGLTSERTQDRFGVKGPVSGVLFASGNRETELGVDLEADKQLMLEAEIGFVVGKLIDRPITNISKFKERIRAVVPAIEIPNLRFDSMDELKGGDIIANNVSAYAYILGETEKLTKNGLKNISLIIRKDGEVINKGMGSDVLGDPWQAAMWLVNNTLSQGWVLEPGHILLTGAIGKILPAIRGKYAVDFDEIGRISFEVR